LLDGLIDVLLGPITISQPTRHSPLSAAIRARSRTAPSGPNQLAGGLLCADIGEANLFGFNVRVHAVVEFFDIAGVLDRLPLWLRWCLNLWRLWRQKDFQLRWVRWWLRGQGAYIWFLAMAATAPEC
jgi:hypothetical protein